MAEIDYDARAGQNTRTLIQISGLRTQKALAKELGWRQDRLSDLLNGHQKWSLSDIADVSSAFGYREDPFVLLRPIGEILTLGEPATGTDGASSHGTARSAAHPYPHARAHGRSDARIIAFPQVTADVRELATPGRLLVLRPHLDQRCDRPNDTAAIGVNCG